MINKNEKQLNFSKVSSALIQLKGKSFAGLVSYEDMHVEGEEGQSRFVVIKKWKVDGDGIGFDRKQIYLPLAFFEELLKVYPKLSLPG